MAKNCIIKIIFSFIIIFVNQEDIYSQDLPNTITLISIPQNESEFTNIFKRSPSNTEMNEILNLISENKDVKNIYFIKKESDIDRIYEIVKQNFLKQRREVAMPKVGFTIIGHNTNGNFYFPNGSHETLENIEKKFNGFAAMFLSCNAKTYIPQSAAIDHKITYSEALKISHSFNEILHSCSIYLQTPRQVAEEMITKLNRQNKIKFTAKFLGATGGSIGSFVLISELDNPQDDKRKDTINNKPVKN